MSKKSDWEIKCMAWVVFLCLMTFIAGIQRGCSPNRVERDALEDRKTSEYWNRFNK